MQRGGKPLFAFQSDRGGGAFTRAALTRVVGVVTVEIVSVAQIRIAVGAVKILVFVGDLEIAVVIATPTPIARPFRGLDLSVEERVADHLDRRVLVAADGAYLRERGFCGDDPLDLL